MRIADAGLLCRALARLGLLLALARERLALPASGEIGAIRRIEMGGEIGTQVEADCLFEPCAEMRQPGRVAGVRVPVARGALDAFELRQKSEILAEPALQQAPLAQKSLMRGLDRDLGAFRFALANHDAVFREQALIHEFFDERQRFRRDFGEPRGAPARTLGLRIDAREPRDEPVPQQSEPRGVIARNARIGVRCRKGALDRCFDRSFKPAEFFVIGEPQLSRIAEPAVELLQCEGKQRQRVAAAAFFEIAEQRSR